MSFDLSQCFDKNNRLQVLLLHKKSRLSHYQEESQALRIAELLHQNDRSTQLLEIAHQTHHECLNHVHQHLTDLGASVFVQPRSKTAHLGDGFPLIITIGGDGTVLEASHIARGNPIFAVNSDPERSVGALCVATQKNFKALFSKLLDGNLSIQPVARIGLKINDQPLPQYALNEILVSHKNPAATSRYFLQVRDQHEEQLSSGVWISGPAGSTGALNSAGGHITSLTDTKLQYAVREPCFFWTTRPSLLGGSFLPEESFEIISQMPGGRIYFDGQFKGWNFPIGDRMSIFNAPPTWLAINADLEKRRVKLSQIKKQGDK